MTVLPIVDRELRVRARLRITFRFRLLAAIGAILIVGVLLLGSLVSGPTPNLGFGIFVALSSLAFLYCSMEGARNTSDCLSQEKRDGTLGLLFLTDLKGYDVVLGKLVANSINSVYGLLAIFPALAIPLVLGGVTGGEFWRQVFALLNALFLSLTFGILVSAVSRDERTCWMWTSFLVLILTTVPALMWNAPASWQEISIVSPFTSFLSSFDRQYVTHADRYWNSILAGQLIAWTSLIAASIALPRCWQDRGPAQNPSTRRAGIFRKGGSADIGPDRRLSRPRFGGSNPVIWLARRQIGRSWALWLLIGGAIGIASALAALTGASGKISIIFSSVYLVMHFTLAVWIASDACHLMSAGRDTGALDLLVSTPLTSRQIIEGHLLALRDYFLRPVATLMLTLAGVLIVESIYTGRVLSFESVLLGGMMFLFLFASALEMQAAATYGLWMGLTTRRPAYAITKTILHVVLLPLPMAFCYIVYPVLAIVKNLAFTNYAREQLRRNFRAAITDRAALPTAPESIDDKYVGPTRGQLPSVSPKV